MTDAGNPALRGLSAAQAAFAARATRRARLFLVLSVVGVAAGLLIAAWTTWRRMHDPDFSTGSHAVIVILVLLNARQNLRQYRYATVLAALLGDPGTNAGDGADVP